MLKEYVLSYSCRQIITALSRLKLPHRLCEMTATTHSERQF